MLRTRPLHQQPFLTNTDENIEAQYVVVARAGVVTTAMPFSPVVLVRSRSEECNLSQNLY